MSVLDKLKKVAKKDKQRILLPEGAEDRTVQAAVYCRDQGFADVTLFGNRKEIEATAAKYHLGLEGIGMIDPEGDHMFQEYADRFYEMRKTKGVTPEKAVELMKNPLYYAAMMVKDGRGDGFISGAINTTANTLRPGLQIIKMAPGIKTVSSFFIMEVMDRHFGDRGILFFADSAVNINPDADQLSDIAIATARNAKGLLGVEPRVAMLSFSTKGSAKHDNVTKVQEATKLVKEKAPDILVDGELQLDAALIPTVQELKAPDSPLKGKANILIFPDVQAGNIGYKLVRTLGRAKAIGPVCQGFASPINDLSRSCSVEDIISMVAVTAVQAQAQKRNAAKK